MNNDAKSVIDECNELKKYWAPRDTKIRVWYKLIQMVDELKTEKMESFVGNDPRSMFNLVLHMLDTDVPHRMKDVAEVGMRESEMSASISQFLDSAWSDVEKTFRHSGPRQSLKRSLIGLLLSTGWYSVFSIITDSGDKAFIDLWNPIQVYPMWDFEQGLSEVAHIYKVSDKRARSMAQRNNWGDLGRIKGDQTIYDLWWVEISDTFPYSSQVWNAIVIGDKLVKFEPTRFTKIPIYVSPTGGLPDTGAISDNSEVVASFNAGSISAGDRWKAEIGQSIVATNEYIYKSWNKWWTFSLQLLRDTAQPRIFERSRSGKHIVKPEDIWKRGAIFRGGPDDSVDFLGTPPIPMELRASQLDLEAMMQRGGVSWAMYGNVTGQMTAYVMSQIAASANQVMRPFHQALQNLYADIDNDWIEDIRLRNIKPYGWKIPSGLPDDMEITADFPIEIPGDLVQKATVARMLDPEFAVSYSYVMNRLFPDVKNPLQERARRLADQAELSPENAIIAQIRFYRKQAAFLARSDAEAARLYELAADATEAQLTPGKPSAPSGQAPVGDRAEGMPRYNIPGVNA